MALKLSGDIRDLNKKKILEKRYFVKSENLAVYFLRSLALSQNDFHYLRKK
jgi:hypothetical protein